MMIRPASFQANSYVNQYSQKQYKQDIRQELRFGMCPLCVTAGAIGFFSFLGSIPIIGYFFRRKPNVATLPQASCCSPKKELPEKKPVPVTGGVS